jgi:uncharacterized membrane protein
VSASNLGRQAGHFAKHVIPAAVKPIHSLWHEVLGFFFLTVAAWGAWKIVRTASTRNPVLVAFLALLVVILAGYGISSFLKARRISRS